MTLSGRGRRQKGANFERLVASVLRLLWETATRGLGQARDARVADLDGVPLRIECKKRSSWVNIGEAMRQVWRDAKAHTDKRPVCVVHAKDHEEPIISFELRQFVKFVEEERARVRETSRDKQALVAFLDKILLDPSASRAVDECRTTDILRQLRLGIIEGKHLDA